MSDVKDLFRWFVRDLRWLVPMGIVPPLALWGLDVRGMRDALAFHEVLLFGVWFTVVFAPMSWVRFGYRGPFTRDVWKFFGLALSGHWSPAPPPSAWCRCSTERPPQRHKRG